MRLQQHWKLQVRESLVHRVVHRLSCVLCCYCCGTCNYTKRIGLFSYFNTVDEVQKKVKSLRTQYGRERQKTGKRKNGDGLSDVYTSKWPHFEKLRFLDDYVTAKQSVSNFKVSITYVYTNLY